ncbi:MAG: extracellular solute-binding protein [Proteobacteria bacterium]|nr:extracellular solute-binding protein [Pseudomonadota bacterium]
MLLLPAHAPSRIRAGYCSAWRRLAGRSATSPASTRAYISAVAHSGCRPAVSSRRKGYQETPQTKALITRAQAASGATAALTGCGGADEAASADEEAGDDGAATPEASGELSVWVDSDRADVLAEAAADFEADTGITVNLVQQDFAEVRDQFVSQVPTGEGPDIAVGAHDWLGVLVTNGVVAPVELGDAAEDFEDVAIEAWTYDGQVYGVPYSIENIALLRNADLVEEAPGSFDEMIELGPIDMRVNQREVVVRPADGQLERVATVRGDVRLVAQRGGQSGQRLCFGAIGMRDQDARHAERASEKSQPIDHRARAGKRPPGFQLHDRLDRRETQATVGMARGIGQRARPGSAADQ